MRLLEKLLKKVLSIICSSLLVLMVIFTFAQIVRRTFFNSAFLWVEEAAVWSMGWMIFLGSGLCILGNKHATIDYLLEKMPARMKFVVRLIIIISCATICGILMVNALPVVKMNLTNISVGLQIPWAVFYGAFPVGALLMILCYIVKLYNLIVEYKDGEAKKL